ncbi:MAG: LamG domain-containing protein [Planctomycetales bacterium]|nr:LamG domain-containing protein [Planctomycetales bacterium]MCA9168251.1 LamG domain-containing protein [Planctomycetales bacterium]
MRIRNKLCMGAVLLAALANSPARAIETAGTLFVDLNASDVTAGSPTWANAGTLGDFIEVGDPQLMTIAGGAQGVVFSGGGDVYQSPVGAPAELTGLDPTRSIEAWVLNPTIAGEETIVSWGHRGGPDGSNVSFNFGSNADYGAVGHWGGADIGWGTNPSAAQWHHLVYTYDGTTSRVYSDGVMTNSEDLGAGVINTHPDTKITVAGQLDSDGVTLTAGLFGSMAIGALRIHDGVLTDAQIAANYAAEVGNYPQPALPGPAVAAPLSAGPIHRYSFNNAAGDATGGVLIDSVGGADGVVLGEGTSFTGTSLKLSGGPSATAGYADLPNGLISSLNEVTFEAWVTLDGAQNWGRIFDFGSSDIGGGVGGEVTGPGGGGEGKDYFELSAGIGTDYNAQRIELRNEDPAGGGTSTLDSTVSTTFPQAAHMAVVFDEAGGLFGETVVRFYRDGQLVNEGTTHIKLSDINDVNNWLGRSNWAGDSNLDGSFDEFRLYDRALSSDEILGNYEAGADTVNVVPEPASLGAAAALALALIGRRRRR